MVDFKNNNHIKTLKEILVSNSHENCSKVTLSCSDGILKSNTLPFLVIGNFWKNIMLPIIGTDLVILIPDFTTSELQRLITYVFTGKYGTTYTSWTEITSIFPDISIDRTSHNNSNLHSEFKVDNIYTCKYCLKEFSRAETCRDHVETHHLKKKSYTCNICGKNFKTYNARKIHEIKEHSHEIESKHHVCPTCGKCFKYEQNLMRHIKTKNHKYPENPVAKNLVQDADILCEICHKYVKNLDHHMKTHHTKRILQYDCEVCDFKTDRKDTLVQHQYLKHKYVQRRFRNIDKTYQTENVNWKCFDCKRTFDSKLEIENHLLLKDCDDVECKICGKKFKQRKNLKQHIHNIHENPQKYNCDKCEKKFAHKSSLVKHTKICKK